MRRPLFIVCLCLVLIAALRLLGGTAAGGLYALGLSEREQVTLTGRVYQKNSENFYLDSIIIQEQAANQRQKNPLENINLSENLICEWEESGSLRLGSTVTVQGNFQSFSQATNPGEFDSRAYYRSMHIGGRLTEVKLLEAGEEYSLVKELLYRLRSYWKERLHYIFPEGEAQIMGAMLLGDKENLDGDLKDLYKRNGIIHILSISGLHITIIGMGIYRLLRRMGVSLSAAAVLGGGILVLYGVMTGMSISAYRAIGMYLLRMLAEICGRTYDMLTALGVMAAIMVLQEPEVLQNGGFLLSFGSVLGIGVLYPALLTEERQEEARYRNGWKKAVYSAAKELKKGLKQSITAGFAITATTLPIQLWFYYEVPTYSLFLNVLVLPFMSVVLLGGLIAMLVPGLGILGTVDCLVLTEIEKLCEGFEELPFHIWNPGRPKLWQIGVYYGLWLAVVLVKRAGEGNAGRTGMGSVKHKKSGKWNKIRNRVFVIQCAILTVAVIVLTAIPGRGSIITFLDVGQGDCVCIQTFSGEVYLFDCGSSSRRNVGKYVLLPFLKYNGIKAIDGVFVSHGDKDHTNGVEELIAFAGKEGIQIKRLILPKVGGAGEHGRAGEYDGESDGVGEHGGAGEHDEDGQFEELLQLVKEAACGAEQEIDICYVKAGDCWENQGAFFRCLHPPAGYEGEKNAASECFYIELWDGKDKKNKLSLLLTGDVEKEGELMLTEELKKYQISEVTLLKVAHHGSRNTTSETFLQQINAAAAVISCGRNNSYGHPHCEVLERLGKESCLLQTPNEGAITVTLKKGRAAVVGYLW